MFTIPSSIKYLSLTLCALGAIQSTQAQKKLSIDDAFLNPRLNPKSLRQVNWQGNSNNIVWADAVSGMDFLVSYNTSTKKKDTLLKASTIDANFKRLPFIFKWEDADKFVYQSAGKLNRYAISSKQVSTILTFDKEAANTDIHKSTLNIAFTKDNNLFLQQGDKITQITKESNKDIVNGQAAHRSEFGITKGTFFSESGKMLAWYRMDQTMVTDYPLVNIETTPASLNNIKYPMAGQKSHQVQVGVYNINTGKQVYLKTTGDPEQYYTNICFTPDDKQILVAIVNRNQDEMNLQLFNAETGDFIRTIFTEKNGKYVEPEHPAIFVEGKPNEFLWMSERSGMNQLYLYNLQGKLIRKIGSNTNAQIDDFIGFTSDKKSVIYSQYINNSLDKVVVQTPLNGGKDRILSGERGINNYLLSDDKKKAIIYGSRFNLPYALSFNTLAKAATQDTLYKAENPLKEYAQPSVELISLKSKDGYTLNGRLLKPANFDKNKKYPVVIYVYGGPHAQMINNGWMYGANLWMNYMAQEGFLLFTLDNRGSGNRGQAFEAVTHRKLGTEEMADQMVGVDWLKGQTFVDDKRIGVHGWSFGGFMTTTLMTKQPDVFKVGVAGGPVIDWKLYEIMYTERYMDTPEQNKEGYEEANLLNYAKNLKGRLMLIHGTIDDVVVWQHSQKFVKKCVEEGKLVDYMIYPEHPHNVGGRDRLHLYRTVTRYFVDFL